jgi:uncharacterized protein (DUF433 family)
MQGHLIRNKDMDEQLTKAQKVLAELQQDYGLFPQVKVQNVLDLLEKNYTQEDIEEAYRQWILNSKNEAYEKLNILRGEFGRCRFIKENTVLGWMEANDTDEEMEAKYQRTVRHGERAEGIDTQMKSAASDMRTSAKHTMEDILDTLETYSRESDAQIAGRVARAVRSTPEMT